MKQRLNLRNKIVTQLQGCHCLPVDRPVLCSTDFEVFCVVPTPGGVPRTIEKSKTNNRFELQFDGIYRNAAIWINGFYVGTNFSGYLGNSYDVSDYMNFENENVIVIRVDATQNEGWFYEGAGSYRHVWLNITEKVFIPENGVYITTQLKDKTASVSIETTIENSNLNLKDFLEG